MDRVVLVARLVPGGHERARELLSQKRPAIEPPFDRLAAFVSPDEVIFTFEGENVENEVREMLNDPVSSTAISPWPPLFDGPLHHAHEMYFLEREPTRHNGDAEPSTREPVS
jgi:hypothetical protein